MLRPLTLRPRRTNALTLTAYIRPCRRCCSIGHVLLPRWRVHCPRRRRGAPLRRAIDVGSTPVPHGGGAARCLRPDRFPHQRSDTRQRTRRALERRPRPGIARTMANDAHMRHLGYIARRRAPWWPRCPSVSRCMGVAIGAEPVIPLSASYRCPASNATRSLQWKRSTPR